MKPFLSAICAAVVITVGMNFALGSAGFSAAETTTGPNVRLGD